ncbi:Diamine acetyltransferase [Roseomonas mucosa]|uniref:Putative acetyltransferase n=1 Tax=Roseomonas mucosa TaxID=207340 RepID=A0A379N576_9PROT|nr:MULTISPECIES: GNAT family N-acetyltransferase [Roseomonas]MBS5901284.1 GNAT family N-acetyltransferase [Acetobacteraceae bacterium]MCG7353476.1 GNAT family N-acetyltransferase [Roseomonas mucosa]MCG7355603.1 GNAT family N-acetyltransferase [Roseomonas mucosa]MDT8288316.1 GNAT family N-acetyltransferase [Roseomonas mucosa]MDT8294434.1 GNAT family N-acetyltransferase [Roseomonas mucosa]
MTPLLRDAVPADIPVLLRLTRALADHEGQPERVTATEDDLRRAFFGAPPVAWALLVERDGVPLGYAAWTFRFRMYSGRSLMHATTVFVEEAARGQGIGRAIFADLARRALAAGCDRLEWGVKDDNVAAVAFYDRLGAGTAIGHQRCYLDGEALRGLAA